MSGVRRDCVCPRARHVHGDYLAYKSDRCRCRRCQAANARRAIQQRRTKAHLAWSTEPRWVDPIGAVRRLQALSRAGWCLDDIGAEMGITKDGVRRFMFQPPQRMRTATAERITYTYDRMWHLTPPNRYALRAQRRGERYGWAEPWQWEGVDLDDPAAEPLPPRDPNFDEVKIQLACEGHPPVLNHAEQLAAVWTLHARGCDDTEIGWRLGMTAAAVFKIRERHFPHTVQRREQAVA